MEGRVVERGYCSFAELEKAINPGKRKLWVCYVSQIAFSS